MNKSQDTSLSSEQNKPYAQLYYQWNSGKMDIYVEVNEKGTTSSTHAILPPGGRVDDQQLCIFVLTSGSTSSDANKNITFQRRNNAQPMPLEAQLSLSGYQDAEEIQTGELNVAKDLQHLKDFFQDNVKYWHQSTDSRDTQRLLIDIREYFGSNDEEGTLFVLCYSGHGSPPTGANFSGGNWMFMDGVVTLEDILDIWSTSDAFKIHTETYLVLVIDACFSGCWAERLNNPQFKNYRVVVQASSQPHQASVDTKFGGAFLCYWLKKLVDPNVQIDLLHSPVFNSTLGYKNIDGIVLSGRLRTLHNDSRSPHKLAQIVRTSITKQTK